MWATPSGSNNWAPEDQEHASRQGACSAPRNVYSNSNESAAVLDGSHGCSSVPFRLSAEFHQ